MNTMEKNANPWSGLAGILRGTLGGRKTPESRPVMPAVTQDTRLIELKSGDRKLVPILDNRIAVIQLEYLVPDVPGRESGKGELTIYHIGDQKLVTYDRGSKPAPDAQGPFANVLGTLQKILPDGMVLVTLGEPEGLQAILKEQGYVSRH